MHFCFYSLFSIFHFFHFLRIPFVSNRKKCFQNRLLNLSIWENYSISFFFKKKKKFRCKHTKRRVRVQKIHFLWMNPFSRLFFLRFFLLILSDYIRWILKLSKRVNGCIKLKNTPSDFHNLNSISTKYYTPQAVILFRSLNLYLKLFRCE